MTWRTFPQKLVSSCVTNTLSDTVQRTQCAMANGVKSKSNFYRQKDCHRSGSTPRRVIMRRRNKVSLLLFFLLTALFLTHSQVQGGGASPTPAVPDAKPQASSD